MDKFGKVNAIHMTNTICDIKNQTLFERSEKTLYVVQMYKNKLKLGGNTMYTQKGKKYIYSVIQANEFIQRGYRCLETGFNSKQRKYYWVFDYNEVQPYYETSDRYVNK